MSWENYQHRYPKKWRLRLRAYHILGGRRCHWCGVQPSDEVHHVRYLNEGGLIVNREAFGVDLFLVCKGCHDKANPDGVHGTQHWVTNQGDLNHNTPQAIARLVRGFKKHSLKVRRK